MGTGKLFFLVIVFSSLNICSCNHGSGSGTKKEPVIECIEGNCSWFSKSKFDTAYFLSFTSDKRDTILYPPKELERDVEISLDVTGSGFEKTVKFNDTVISLAEYNVIKFCKLLEENNILKAGDAIKLRLFGSKPNGKNIQLDQTINLFVPKAKIDIEFFRLRRKRDNLKMTVYGVEQGYNLTDLVLKIKKWGLENIAKNRTSHEVYFQSPILENIRNIHFGHKEDQRNKNKEKLYIFVTDGHFYVGNFEFKPSNYTEHSVLEMREDIVKHNLYPTFDSTDKVKIIFVGLNSEGNESYLKTQKEMLSWFISPINAVQFYTCDN